MVGNIACSGILVAGLALVSACAEVAHQPADPREVSVAHVTSPETGRSYNIPLPAGLCRPDPDEPFTSRIPRSVVAFVPCKLAEGAPRRYTEVSPLITVPFGDTPGAFMRGIRGEMTAEEEFGDLFQADATVRTLIASQDVATQWFRRRLVDRDGEVRFWLFRVANTTLIQVMSMVAIEDQVFYLADVEYRSVEDGGASVPDLTARRKAWLQTIRAAHRTALAH